jgi:hypothetical protein
MVAGHGKNARLPLIFEQSKAADAHDVIAGNINQRLTIFPHKQYFPESQCCDTGKYSKYVQNDHVTYPQQDCAKLRLGVLSVLTRRSFVKYTRYSL